MSTKTCIKHGEPLVSPTGPGKWLVRHKSGEWWEAKVVESECTANVLYARIPGCGGSHWHHVDWINLNGWVEWKRPANFKLRHDA